MNAVSLDRIKTHLARLVENVTRRVDYFALYPCKVVSQNNDGTLELKPDSTRLPGLSKVRIRHGLPGVAVKIDGGSRVLLGFEGGSPTAPYAALWEFDGAKLTEIAIGDGPTSFIALATAVKDRLDALQTAINTHTHDVSTTGTATAQTGTAAPTTNGASGTNNVASTKVKST